MDFETLSRKELQALAKEHGIKANSSNAAIIEQLKNVAYENREISNDDVHSSPTKPIEEIEQECNIEIPMLKKRKSCDISSSIATPKKAITSTPQAIKEGPFTVTKVQEENFSLAAEEATVDEVKVLQVGNSAFCSLNDSWLPCVIKRVNKASYRVVFVDGKELTMKMDEVREYLPISVSPIDDCNMENIVVKLNSPFQAVNSEDRAILEEFIISEGESNQQAELDINETANEESEDGEDDEVEEEAPNENHQIHDEADQTSRMECEVEENEESESIDEKDIEYIESVMNSYIAECDDLEEDEEEDEEEEEEEKEISTDNNINSADQGVLTLDDLDTFDFDSKPSKRPRKSLHFSNSVSTAKTPQRPQRETFGGWNSSTKLNPAFQMGSAEKKRFSITPNKATSKPIIVPKMNVAQKLRLEALQKKKSEGLNGQISTSNTAQAVPAKKAEPQKPQPAHSIKVQKNESVKVDAKAPMATKKTPNFKRLHQKQFESSKPITNLVQRNPNVVRKMDEAFEKALKNDDKQNIHSQNFPKKKPSNLVTTVGKSSLVQKEKPVASFLSQSQSKNKENALTNSFVNSSHVRVNPKDASKVVPQLKNRENRIENFKQDNKAKRDETLQKKRDNTLTEVRAENPFGDFKF